MTVQLRVYVGYLTAGYLTGNYLVGVNGGYFGMQAMLVVKRHVGMQALLHDHSHPHTGMQATATQAGKPGMQATMVIYNVTQLRILGGTAAGFPSRGVSGSNWTSNSTASGDFSPNNLNTDIPEQATRSNALLTGWVLTCDSQLSQGVFLDTWACLNHNLTRSASFVVQGSNDPTFSSIGTQFTVSVETPNAYYIAPALPQSGYRYWRHLISDPTNTNPYLQIGIIVFGASQFLPVTDDFDNPIDFRKVVFADKLATEGYTAISNLRAVRSALKLTFTSLDPAKGGWGILQTAADYLLTTLKALWIPTPQTPSRYAAFGKLTEYPDGQFTDNGPAAQTVDAVFSIDESL